MNSSDVAVRTAHGGFEAAEFTNSAAEREHACRTLCVLASGPGGLASLGVTAETPPGSTRTSTPPTVICSPRESSDLEGVGPDMGVSWKVNE